MRSKTDLLVIHRAEVWDHEYHFIVRRDGSLLQLIDLNAVGTHAYKFNRASVGVALEGDFATAEPGRNAAVTPEQWDAALLLCAGLLWWYGPLTVKGHTELGPDGTRYPDKLSYNPDHSCPGLNLDLEKFRTELNGRH